MAKKKKVSKPSKDYPLFPHASGQWCKKIDTKQVYFGVLADPVLARERYDNFRKGKGKFTDAELEASLEPGEISLEDLVNEFLSFKLQQVENNELSQVTLANYTRTCENMLGHLNHSTIVTKIESSQFTELRAELSKTRGHVALTNELQRVRTVFKWGYDHNHIESPIRGLAVLLKPPSKKSVRIERNSQPKRLLSAVELRTILAACGPIMRAMTLLGINCGFGNTDIATLPETALDLKSGFVNYARPKTGIVRRAPLWPETVDALKLAIEKRPAAISPDAVGCAFITRWGSRWVHKSENTPQKAYKDSVGLEFGKLLRRLGLKRQKINFYTLRHVLQTVGGECLDQPALDLVFGHGEERNDMSANYRHDISDDRLKRITDGVRLWLWPAGSESKQVKADEAAARAKAAVETGTEKLSAAEVDVTTTKPKASRKRTTKV